MPDMYDRPQDASRLRATEAGACDEQLPARPSRIPVEALVTVQAGTCGMEATACDVSQNGLKIELDTAIPVGPVTVKLAGLPAFSGEIRWRGPHHVGVKLLRPIPWDFLTAWVNVHGFRRRG